MKKLIVSLAALAAVVGAQASSVFTIDDFGVKTMVLSSGGTLSDSGVVATTGVTRTLTLSNGTGTFAADVNSSFTGELSISNSRGSDSTVEIVWDIGALVLPANATNVGFYFNVTSLDGNGAALKFKFNDAPIADFTLVGPIVSATEKPFSLTAAQLAAVSGGGKLSVTIDGDSGWDFGADVFGFTYDVPTVSVPEPASLALLGLGLAGAALARRRKA